MKKAYITSVLLFLTVALLFNIHPVTSDTSEHLVRTADLNGDGIVDMRDVAVFSKISYSTPEDEDWDPRYDINGDSCIDIVDKILTVNSFGETVNNRISSFGMHSDNWSWQEKNRVYNGLIELPDVFVSRLEWVSFIRSLHEKQPGKKIIIYRNLRKVDRTRTEGWADLKPWRIAEYEFARRNNVICNNSLGNDVYSTSYGRDYLLADIGNPKWQQFIADWIKFYIDNYDSDGVYLDNGLSVAEDGIYWGVSAKPINPRTGTFYTDKEISRYINQTHQRIRDTIGDDKLIICNGIYHGETFFSRQQDYMEILDQNLIDGFLSEGIFGGQSFWEEKRWLRSVNFIEWLQNNWLTKGKFLVANLNMHSPSVSTSLSRVWVGFEDGYSLKHSMTYHFTSLLMGVKAEFYELDFFSSRGYWHEQFAQELYSLDLGEPKSSKHQIGSTSVYARTFEKGLVMVNPTKSTKYISLSENYKTLDGKTVSGHYDIGGFEGVVLLNAK